MSSSLIFDHTYDRDINLNIHMFIEVIKIMSFEKKKSNVFACSIYSPDL